MAKLFYALVLIIQWCLVLHNTDLKINLVVIINGINALFTFSVTGRNCERYFHALWANEHSRDVYLVQWVSPL